MTVAPVLHLHEAPRARRRWPIRGCERSECLPNRSALQPREPLGIIVRRAWVRAARQRLLGVTRGGSTARTGQVRTQLCATDQRLVLQIHAPPERAHHRLRHILRAPREWPHRRVDLCELCCAQVHRAATNVHRTGRFQRASHRLARLRLSLAGDAARVDYVQLRFLLGRLFVPCLQQLSARQHRVGV